MKVYKQILALIVLLSLSALTGCGSLEEAVQQARMVVPGDWQVLHTEQLTNQAAVVFYVRNKELGVGLFQKDTFGWNWLGSGLGTLVTYPEGLTWRYSELGDQSNPYFLYYGTVINPEITNVEVKTTWGEVSKAQIINVDDQRLWYTFISHSQIPSVDADITGYASSGEVLYLFSQPKQGG